VVEWRREVAMQNLLASCIVLLAFPFVLYCYFAFRVLRWSFWPTTIGGALLISLCVAVRSFYETFSPFGAIFDALFGFPFYLAAMAVVSWATKTTFFKEKKENKA